MRKIYSPIFREFRDLNQRQEMTKSFWTHSKVTLIIFRIFFVILQFLMWSIKVLKISKFSVCNKISRTQNCLFFLRRLLRRFTFAAFFLESKNLKTYLHNLQFVHFLKPINKMKCKLKKKWCNRIEISRRTCSHLGPVYMEVSWPD